MAKTIEAIDPELLPEFVFVQSSQWLPGSPADLEEGTDFVLSQNPSIVALTEIFSPARSKRLKEEGYTPYHEVGTDSAALWDSDIWRPLYAKTEQVTELTYWTKEGKPTKPQKAVFVVLEHLVTGHRVLLVATHYPPRTEGTGGPGGIWRPELIRRWSVTQSAIAGIRSRRSELRKEFKVDAEIVTGDWNLNIMRAAVRAWFAATLPGLKPNFSTSYKGAGTIGGKKGRVIDFSLLRHLTVMEEPVVFKVVGTDHKSASTKLKFKKPPRTPLVVVPPEPPAPEPTLHLCPDCDFEHLGVLKTPS